MSRTETNSTSEYFYSGRPTTTSLLLFITLTVGYSSVKLFSNIWLIIKNMYDPNETLYFDSIYIDSILNLSIWFALYCSAILSRKSDKV